MGFLSLLITWLLIGLWHGISGTFVIWGIYFAVLLYVEGFALGEELKRVPKGLRWFFTMLFVMISWVFFFSSSAGGAFSYLRYMFIGGGGGFINAGAIDVMTDYSMLWILAVFFLCRWHSISMRECFAAAGGGRSY